MSNMEIHNGKKMNFKRIYSQIAKYGKTISELAVEYGMEEEEFVSRLEMGLDPKLFSSAMKANERHLKNKKKLIAKAEQSQKNEEVKDEITTTEEKDVLAILKDKKTLIEDKISQAEVKEQEAKNFLAQQELIYKEAQQTLESAEKGLLLAQDEYVSKMNALFSLQTELEQVEIQIMENKVYLVAPNYSGKKQEVGRFVSTKEIPGWCNVEIVEVNPEYAIEPEFKDMVLCGYDSISQYNEALCFVMLCLQFTYEEVEFTVLNDDTSIEKLLHLYIE